MSAAPIGRPVRALVTIGIAAAACLGAFGPAAGASAESAAPLLYSADGVNWSPTPPASLFPGWRPVPGDSRTATLHVQSTRPGDTIVAVYAGRASGSDPELLQHTRVSSGSTDLSLDTLVDGPVSTGTCALLGTQSVLRPGEQLSVPVTFSISADLGAAQGASVGLGLLVALSETGPIALSNGCPVDAEIIAAFPTAPPTTLPTAPSTAEPAAPNAHSGAGGSGALPRTGLDAGSGIGVAALALLLGGVAVVGNAARRRRLRALPTAAHGSTGDADDAA
ncbi:hypothetical protein KXS11_08580 [Plantibacter flavus]|uniref:hypothetical protein n=1 Tax=Plantibacter flavus TaxID=150123 RepID=UPI003F189D64